MEPRTTFLQRYASEAGGDAAFGLRAQWRRTDFECADSPCGVDQPAKIWRALGEVQVEKMVRRHYFFELLLLLGGASVAWETDSVTQGGSETRRLPASPRPCYSAVHVGRQTGRQAGWTGVRLSGLVCGWVLRGAVALVERGGNMSGLAWRYAREAQTGARYGAPRVAVPVDELQSQPRCRSVCMCMCVVSVKSAAA